MRSALVLGGGVAGTSIAYLLAKKNWKVTLLERAPFLGGGFKTFYYGGHPYTCGPRPMISRNEEKTGIFRFVNSILPMRKIKHGLLTYVERDGQFYSYPVHEDDIPLMPDAEVIKKQLSELKTNPPPEPTNFEEFWVSRLGRNLYDKYINTYSKKMWQLKSNTDFKDFKWSPKGAALKSGSRFCVDDCIVAYPYAYDGYDEYFRKTTADVDVRLNCDVSDIDAEKRSVKVGTEWLRADVLVSSISLDQLMNNRFGELPYLGRDFIKLVLPVREAFSDSIQFIYYPNEEPFTRVVEYKKLSFYESSSTLLLLELPSKNGKLYPLPLPEPRALAEKYLAALPKDVYALGRLGTYIYDLDMERIILQAQALSEQLA